MQPFLVDLLVAASTASATVLLSPDSLPSTLNSECTAALTVDVTACDPPVRHLRPDVFYPPASLRRICTSNCSSAIEMWRSSVKARCGNQTVTVDLGVEAAAVHIPGTLQYSFQNACLRDDSGRYCGPVAALAAAFADPGISPFNYVYNTTGQERPDKCDACLAERLRFREGSPYFDGPIAARKSLYASMTASCGIADRPVVTTTVDYFTAAPPAAPTAGACEEGSAYTLKASDDCYSVSRSQGIGTDWLLADNNLAAFCADFPTTAGCVLCINNRCTTATVPVNATCGIMAAAANITEAQLKSWNPSISHGCANLRRMNGSEVCVGAPGRKFVAPNNTAALPPQTPTTAAPKPTDATEGSGGEGKPCGRWYSIQQGDYCNLVTVRFGIALDDFLFLNPALNANCTNLFASESYCIAAVGDINTYSGRPGHGAIVTLDPSAPFDGVGFTERPDATGAPYSRLYTEPLLASGTRAECVHYFTGDDFQFDLAGSSFASNCELAAETYNVDLEAFGLWNAGLGDVSDPKCAFEKGVRYCGSWYVERGGPGAPAVTTTVGGGEDSTNTSSTSTSPTSTSPTNESPTNTSPTPPGPTMSGSPADCNKWSLVTDGLSCADMASEAGISLKQFLAWNPAISPDCLTNYWLGEAYCVSVSGGSAPTKTTSGPPGPTAEGKPGN